MPAALHSVPKVRAARFEPPRASRDESVWDAPVHAVFRHGQGAAALAVGPIGRNSAALPWVRGFLTVGIGDPVLPGGLRRMPARWRGFLTVAGGNRGFLTVKRLISPRRREKTAAPALAGRNSSRSPSRRVFLTAKKGCPAQGRSTGRSVWQEGRRSAGEAAHRTGQQAGRSGRQVGRRSDGRTGRQAGAAGGPPAGIPADRWVCGFASPPTSGLLALALENGDGFDVLGVREHVDRGESQELVAG